MSASYLRPKRGKRSTAESKQIVLTRGELFIEAPEAGVGKGAGRIKIGDGVSRYTDLPYFLNPDDFTPEAININDSTVTFTPTAETNNETILNRITSGRELKTIVAATKNLLLNLNNSVSTLNTNIGSMQTNLETSVNSIYDALDDKGATPASHSLSDIIAAINSIGGGSYSMFLQEIPDLELQEGGCTLTWMKIKNNYDFMIGHLIASENNSITLNFYGYLSFDGEEINFSLVIDNSTVIPNITTITNTNTYIEYSFSYTLPSSLTPGYHTIAIRSNYQESYGVYGGYVWLGMANLIGSNFIAAVPGGYLYNGNFIQFTPNNFIIPINPIQYTLDQEGSGGCGAGVDEDIESAMNDHYSTTFDNGVSYHMKKIDNTDYETDDTLIFNNDIGKIIYCHSESRSFDDSVNEYHYFILPIKGDIFKYCKYINIHCKMAPPQGEYGYAYGAGELGLMVLKRINQNRVEFSDSSLTNLTVQLDHYSYSYSQYESYGDHFTVSLSTEDINNLDVNFIAIAFTNVPTDAEEFAVEIDKIWGTNSFIGDNDND